MPSRCLLGRDVMKAVTQSMLPVVRSPLRALGRRLTSDAAISRLRNPNDKMVLQVAAPKSGSTWVTRVLGTALKVEGWRQSIGYYADKSGHREQVFDPRAMLQRGGLTGDVFCANQHCPYSEDVHRFLAKHKVRVIVQVRDLLDSLVSFIDHLDRNAVVPMVFTTTEHWASLSDEDKQYFVGDLLAPWYIRFWAGWSQVLDDPSLNIRVVRYGRLVDDPVAMFSELWEFATDEPATPEQVDRMLENAKQSGKTRFNQGVKGRGRELPEQIRDRARSWTRFYPGVDFGPLGL